MAYGHVHSQGDTPIPQGEEEICIPLGVAQGRHFQFVGDPRRKQTPAEVLLNAEVSFPLFVSPTSYNVIAVRVNGLIALHGAQNAPTIAGDQGDPQVPIEQGQVCSMLDDETQGVAWSCPHPSGREGAVLVVKTD